MSVDLSTFSPRDRARRLAAHGVINLVRVLVISAFVLGLGAVLDVLAEPAFPAPWVATTGGILRALVALALAWMAWPLRAWARALGLAPWVVLASFLALASAALALAPLVGVEPPASVPAAVWRPLLATTAFVSFGGALMLLLLVVARFAAKEDMAPTARALTWSNVALVGALVAGFAVLDPALLPAWWLGPAVALAVPWALAAGGIIGWDKAAWPSLFVGAIGVLLMVMRAPEPLVCGLGALTALIYAAVVPRGPLAEVAAVLGEEPAAAPSRTFIRRLLDGPDASQAGPSGARLGSQAAASSPDDGLALAYRELGIDPPKRPPASATPADPATPAAPAPPSAPTPEQPALPPLPAMAKLEPLAPKTRPSLRLIESPREAPDEAETWQWGQAVKGLHDYFVGFITRAATLVASFMLGQGPLGRKPIVIVLEILVFAVGGGAMLIGLWRLLRLPERATARAPARVALVVTIVMLLSDLAVLALHALASDQPDLIHIGVIVDSAAWFVATAAMLVALHRLFADLGGPSRGKTVATAVQLVVYSALASAAAVIGASSDSELAWLAIPMGVATAVVGLSFFVSMLWLVTDARTAIFDWEVRVRRAHAPDAREDGDPDPAA
ncbi:MAG: hypothetical protein U1F43_23080 [Myxococcota bacterium]